MTLWVSQISLVFNLYYKQLQRAVLAGKEELVGDVQERDR